MKRLCYLFYIIFCIFIITGCNYNKNIKRENDVDKYEKLSKYLISIGWEKDANSKYDFSLKKRDILDENDKPVNVDWYSLNIKKMNIQRVTRISKFSATTTDYSLKSNIATGNYILLNDNDEWDKYVSFSYDFNGGNLTIDDKASSSLCTNLSVGLKEELENIIKDSDLDVEDFK